MHITAIESMRKNGRVRVVTDSGIRFPLYGKEVRQYGLMEGMELSEDLYRQIREETLVKRAEKRLLYLLQSQDRTEWQLRQKLAGDGYPQDVTDEAIAYVRSFHYIDDYRYACAYIRYHQNQKTRIQMMMQLRQKGIATDILESAMEESYSVDEETLAARLLQKRGYDAQEADEKEKRRTYHFLARKGFHADTIRHVMNL